MIFRVTTLVEVDPDSFWVPSDLDKLKDELEDQVRNVMYELDFKVVELEVEEE